MRRADENEVVSVWEVVAAPMFLLDETRNFQSIWSARDQELNT